MIEQSSPLQVALAYHRAWTGHDLDRAMEYIADDVVQEAPGGWVEGAAAYRESLAHFVEILERADLWAAFGDDTTAVVVYDTKTTLVESGPGAECVTVRDGKIVHSRLIFDRLPFAQTSAG
jgi:ketosteroid isomerase-like protein